MKKILKMNNTQRHESERYILKLVNRLNKDYGVYVKVKIKNTKSTYHRKCRRTLQHSIVFGMKNIAFHYELGYKEYDSIQYVWGSNSYRKAKNIHAVHNIVLHEYAHVLQTDRYKRKKGVVHNHEFVKCLYELIKKYPYYEKSEYSQINNARSKLNQMLAGR